MSETISNRVLLRRSLLSSVIAAGSGDLAAPASGATITLWDSTADDSGPPQYLSGVSLPGRALNFRRLIVPIYSSHASGTDGVIFEGSIDGTNWYFSDTYTLAATTGTKYIYHVTTPHVRVRYTNSANTLTAWGAAVIGDESSADPGV